MEVWNEQRLKGEECMMRELLETAFFFGVLVALWFVFDYLWEVI